MTSFFPFLGTLLFSISVFAQDNLFLDHVKNKNMAVKSYEEAFKSEKVMTGSLGRSFFPTLSFQLGQEDFQTGRYNTRIQPYASLEAHLNLFRGGRDEIESKINDLKTQIAGNTRTLAFRAELNKVRKLQYQIIYNNELITVIEKEIKDNEKIKAQANQRAASGVSSKTDILEFTIYESQLHESVESLRHENKILIIGLLPLLGIDSDEGLNLKGPLEHQHDDVLLNRNESFRKHPQVATLDAEHERLNLERKSNNLWWTPSFDLYGGYFLYTLRDRDYVDMSARDDRVVGIRLTFELFDGLKSRTQSKSDFYQAESKRILARHTERQNDSQFLMLKEDMKHTHEVMHYVLDRILKSKEYLKRTISEYDRGVKNSLDALTAMQRYYGYEKQYLEKRKEYLVIKADLLSLMGE